MSEPAHRRLPPGLVTLAAICVSFLIGGGVCLLILSGGGNRVQRLASEARAARGESQEQILRRLASLGPEGRRAVAGMLEELDGAAFGRALDLVDHTEAARSVGRKLLLSNSTEEVRKAAFILARSGQVADMVAVMRGVESRGMVSLVRPLLLTFGRNSPDDLMLLHEAVMLPGQRMLIWEVFVALELPSAAPLVRRQLEETPNPEAVAAATEALLSLQPDSLPQLVEDLACHPLRAMAVPALVKQGPRLLPLLMDVGEEEDPRIAGWKLRLLGQVAPDTILPLLRELLSSGSAPLKLAALETIGTSGARWQELAKPISRLLRSRDEEVVLLATKACGSLVAEECVTQLVMNLNIGSFEVRRASASALARYQTRSAHTFLRRRFFRERNCLIRSFLAEVLINGGRLRRDQAPDCSSYCFCGEWALVQCADSLKRYCREHQGLCPPTGFVAPSASSETARIVESP